MTRAAGRLLSGARSAFAGWAPVAAHATGAELLEAVRPVLERRCAAKEAETVARWHDALGQNSKASAGWGPTVEAASDGRVNLLLYESRANQALERCSACGRIQFVDGGCQLDSAELERCDDGIDLVLHRTLEFGGTVLPVVQDGLADAGGIGALLRY